MCSILISGFVLGTPTVYCEQPLRGVAGVEVKVKENPAKRFVTDARGTFAIHGLSPGSYTLVFKAQKTKENQTASTSAVVVAQSYSIKLDGAKRPISRSAVSDQLITGLAVPVQVGAGAQVRGQVAAAQTQKMVWIAPELGSHIPGHWASADSAEAKGHGARATQWMKGDDVQRFMDSHDSMHQEGFGGGGH